MAMTQLELQQRGLLNLIKGRCLPSGNNFLQRVAGSHELAMIRRIALWWRAFQLKAQCPFASRLLKRLGRFDSSVATYFDNNATSPFVEELSLDFLTFLSVDEDSLVRSVSLFEQALLKTRAGSPEIFEVFWDRHPDLVFGALMEGTEIPNTEPEHLYCMRIAQDLPHMVECALLIRGC